MHDSFDPYHQWLGILPSEQPANWYRLLGLKLWEKDPQAIEQATQRQIAIARQHQNGPHAFAAQQVLTQIASARQCLLSAARKVAYDQHLREQLQGIPPPPPPSARPNPLPPAAVPMARPIAATGNVPMAKAVVAAPIPSSIPILQGPAPNAPPVPLDATVMLPPAHPQDDVDDDAVADYSSNGGRWKTTQEMHGAMPLTPPIVPIPMQPHVAPQMGPPYPTPFGAGPMAPPPPAATSADAETAPPKRRSGSLLTWLAIPVFLLGMLGVTVGLFLLLRPQEKPVEKTLAQTPAETATTSTEEEPVNTESDPVSEKEPETKAKEADPSAPTAAEIEEAMKFVPGAPPPTELGMAAPMAVEIPEPVDMVMKDGKKRSYSPDLYRQDIRQGIYFVEKSLEQREIAKAAGHIVRTRELFDSYSSFQTEEIEQELDDYAVIVELNKEFWEVVEQAALHKALAGDMLAINKQEVKLVSRNGEMLEVEHAGMKSSGTLQELPSLALMAFYASTDAGKGEHANRVLAAFGSMDGDAKKGGTAKEICKRAYRQVARKGFENNLIAQNLGLPRKMGKGAMKEVDDEFE